MKTRTAILAAVLGTALAVPSTALADKSFAGKTAQNRSVTLTTGDDNVLKTFRINWITRRCAQSGSRFQHMTAFRPPFDLATGDEFRDAGSFRVRDDGGIRSRVRITITGRHAFDPANPAAENWFGTVKARIVVRRRGRIIDRCNLRSTNWSAGIA
ncbi:MAG: hypothetical protein M3320_06165 [Actinomycetota bacterium]|nr:hypothetical protein [Actinomycetota bacterium]MDQ5808244.1 hypothetical protein [Actinomycetota bacterium]